MRPEIALIEPDIAGNVGAILRTAACLGITVHIVEPCGFPFGVRALRRAGMDYAASANIIRHADIAAFLAAMVERARRMVVLSDASKFEQVSLHRIALLDQIHAVVTDAGIPAEFREALQQRGIEVIVTGTAP